MSTIVTVTALGLGAILILTDVVVTIIASVRTTPGSATLDAANHRLSDLLDAIATRAPLVAAGILLVLIAAVASGTFSADVAFG